MYGKPTDRRRFGCLSLLAAPSTAVGAGVSAASAAGAGAASVSADAGAGASVAAALVSTTGAPDTGGNSGDDRAAVSPELSPPSALPSAVPPSCGLPSVPPPLMTFWIDEIQASLSACVAKGRDGRQVRRNARRSTHRWKEGGG